MTNTSTDTTPADAARQTAATAADQGAAVASTATDEARRVADTTVDEAKGVAQVAADQASTVTTQAIDQARTVLDGATVELRDQLEQRLRDLSSSARTTADELQALVDGRPDDAGRTRDLAASASDHIARLADRADNLGVQGVIEEASDLARRRPVLFLAGAATAGLLVGRMARAGREVGGSTSGGEAGELPTGTTAGATDPGGPAAGGVGA